MSKCSCDMDCFNCKRPAGKCHGGNYKKAVDRGANRLVDGKGDKRLECSGSSRKSSNHIYEDFSGRCG